MTTSHTYEKRSNSLIVRRPKVPKKVEVEVEEEKFIPCGYCGSTRGMVSGDNAWPGYDGYPMCIACQGV